jgi:hypothetical protein
MVETRRRLTLGAIKGLHTVAFFVIGVFVANGFVCPLTPLAECYGAKRGSVSDIILPEVIALNLTWSGSAILLIGIMLNVRALRRAEPAAYTPGVDFPAEEDPIWLPASSP